MEPEIKYPLYFVGARLASLLEYEGTRLVIDLNTHDGIKRLNKTVAWAQHVGKQIQIRPIDFVAEDHILLKDGTSLKSSTYSI